MFVHGSGYVRGSYGQCPLSATLQSGDEAQSCGPILINGSPGNSVQCESEELRQRGKQGTVAKHGCSMKSNFRNGFKDVATFLMSKSQQ